MPQHADRVRDITASTGTGAITLSNSPPNGGYRTFATAFGINPLTVAYCIQDASGSSWEVGSGTFDGTTGLTRDIVVTSSNSGSLVDFPEGTKDVFCTYSARLQNDTYFVPVVPGAGVDNTTVLQATAAWVAANNFNGVLQFPAGDIYHSGQIDWTGGKPISTWYGGANDRISYPTFRGAGPSATRIRFTGTGNVSAWRFYQTDAQAASGIIRNQNLRIENLEFIGPGVTVAATTLIGAVDPSAQTLILASDIAAVGDVIQVREDTTDTTMWLPVLAVSGSGLPSGLQTVTFSQVGDTRRQLPASSFNGLSSDGVALVFKQTRAIQLGGVSTTRSCIGQSIVFTGCRFVGWFGAVALDDVTNFSANNCEIAGCLYGFEHGYNIDTFTATNAFLGSDQADFKFSFSSGNTITVDSADGIVAGMTLNEPGATRNLHKHSVVTGVSGTTVTLSENYTGSVGAGKSGRCHMGTLLANGAFRTPFQSAFPTNDNVGGTNTLLVNPVAGRVKQLVDWGDIVAVGLVLQNPYVEAMQQMVTLGYPGASGSGQLRVIGGKVEGAETLTAAAIEDIRGVAFIDVDGLRCGGTGNYPMVSSSSVFSKIRLGPGWTWTNAQDGGAAVKISTFAIPKGNEGSVWEFNLGYGTGGGYGNIGVGGCRGSSVTATWSSSQNLTTLGVSEYDATITGAATINITDGNQWGTEVTFRLEQGGAGGFVVTFGANMVDFSDTTVGSIGSGATGTRVALTFRCIGSTKWMLVTPKPTVWVTSP